MIVVLAGQDAPDVSVHDHQQHVLAGGKERGGRVMVVAMALSPSHSISAGSAGSHCDLI